MHMRVIPGGRRACSLACSLAVRGFALAVRGLALSPSTPPDGGQQEVRGRTCNDARARNAISARAITQAHASVLLLLLCLRESKGWQDLKAGGVTDMGKALERSTRHVISANDMCVCEGH